MPLELRELTLTTQQLIKSNQIIELFVEKFMIDSIGITC